MAHFIVEHSDNVPEKLIHDLFVKVHDYLIVSGVFPVGGIRSRAQRMTNYYVADGRGDYAFVHITFKVGSGRELATRQAVGDGLFAVIEGHFADYFERHLLGLTFEITEIHPTLTYKANNIHQYIKKHQASE